MDSLPECLKDEEFIKFAENNFIPVVKELLTELFPEPDNEYYWKIVELGKEE